MTWETTPNNRGGLVINWRSETFPRRSPRYGVISDGFYEWSGQQPHCFHRPDHALVILAGMWKMQELKDGGIAQSFVVLTTRANGLMAPIHDRMPVVLEESRFDELLDPKTPETALRASLRPGAEGVASRWPRLAARQQRQKRCPRLLAGLIDRISNHGRDPTV